MNSFENTLSLIKEYQALELSKVIDYTKLNLFAITHHSTSIEGSTLTEQETRLLLEEDLTPKGKPLAHSLMTKDHLFALKYAIKKGEEKANIEESLIKEINALVLKNTGAVYNTVLGTIDSSKGEYRLGNVSAGNHYFINYSKVPQYTKQLCVTLQEKIKVARTQEEQLILSFDAHFDLVSIHPFYDGNGRTSRLLMNFIQTYFGLPLSIIFKEDKIQYFESLEKTRSEENMTPFRDFMIFQYEKHLKREIDNFKKSMDKPFGLSGFSLVF